MKLQQKSVSVNKSYPYLRIIASLLFLPQLMLAAPLMASDYSIFGESNTILRLRTTTDDKDFAPIYEYLNVGMSDKLADGSSLSLQLGAWGRYDLADRSTNEYYDSDLQYGYISYRAAKNNTVVNAGRQFVSEGVAAERLDGIYVKSAFMGGIGASAFAGRPVLSETDMNGANLVYGARLSHTMPNLYSIGISSLKNEEDSGSGYREESGVDLWVHPVQQFDLIGRSSYNSITNDWMEHAYTISIVPINNLRISGGVNNINYRDYFHNVTSRVFSLTDGILDKYESLLSIGTGISYTLLKNITVSVDYKNYNYDNAGTADYYGGKVAVSMPDIISAGAAFHRMDGANDRLSYSEYRLYAQKNIGKLDMAADLIDVSYDNKVNGVRNSVSVFAAAGYALNEKLRIGANVEYQRSHDFDNDIRGLVKVTYAFDNKHGEGRGKGEK